MPKGFEGKQKKEYKEAPLDLREKVKTVLKGLGITAAGIAAFEIATSGGNLKDKEQDGEYIRKALTPPRKEMVEPHSPAEFPYSLYKKPDQEQIEKMREVLRTPGANLGEKSEEAIDGHETRDKEFYLEFVRTDPFSFLIELEGGEFSNIPDARTIFMELSKSTVHRNRDTQERLFDALPKIKAMGILSEEDFDAFRVAVVERHPKMYIHRLMGADPEKILPREDPDTITRAMRKDPSVFWNAYTQTGGIWESDDRIEQAVYSQGSDALQYLYGMFTDRQHEGYAKYSHDQKEDIVMLFSLVDQGDMTFDEAANIRNTDTIGYWQKIIRAAHAEERMEVGSDLARDSMRGIINSMINFSQPENEFLKLFADRLSTEELQTVVIYGEAHNSRGQEIHRELIRLYEEKISSGKQSRSWKDSMEIIPPAKAMQMLVAVAGSVQMDKIFGDLEPEAQETLLRNFFDEVRKTPASATPDLATVLASLKDSSLLGLAKNHIEGLYSNARTDKMKNVAALLARVVHDVNPDPEGSPFARIASRGADVMHT